MAVINLVSPEIKPSAVLVADTGLFVAPLDASNNYRPKVSLGTQLGAGTLPLSLTQILKAGSITPITVSAAFEINSISGGFLPPRVTTAQRNLFTPSPGLTVFVTDLAPDGGLSIYNNAGWVDFTSGNGNVTGIAPTVIGNLAQFTTTNADEISDSGIALTDVVLAATAAAAAGNIPVYSDLTGRIIEDSGTNIVNVGAVMVANTSPETGNQISNLSHIQLVTNNVNTNDCNFGIESATSSDFVYLMKFFRTDNAGPSASIVVTNNPALNTYASESGIFEINSTTSTFLNNRMTTAQMNSLVNPQNGMQVYVTDVTPGLYLRDGGSWVHLASGGGSFPFRELVSGNNTSLYMGTGFNTTASGTKNLGAGANSLPSLTTGNSNIWLGAVSNAATINNSSNNIIISQNANIPAASTINNCMVLGFNSGWVIPNATNRIAIGTNALVQSDGCMVIGAARTDSVNRLNVGIGTQNPLTALHVDGGQTVRLDESVSDITLDETDYLYIGNTAAGDINATLPSANANTGRILILNNIPSSISNNTLFVVPAGGQTIQGGGAPLGLNPNESMGLISEGNGNWAIYMYPFSTAGFIKGIDTTSLPADNLFIGDGAGNLTLSGNGNIGFSRNALDSLTSGNFNLAIGPASQRDNQTGSNNISLGSRSLRINQDGSRLIALGVNALQSLVTGVDDLIAIGDSSLSSNTSGTGLIAIGTNSLSSNVSGFNSIAIGTNVLTLGTTASRNIGIGDSVLSSIVSGTDCVGIGQNVLRNNTANKNIGIGTNCLINNTTGTECVAIAFTALNQNVSGSQCIAIGDTALGFNQTGSFCLAVGVNSLAASTASNNLGLGYAALNSVTSQSNVLAFGNLSAANVNGGTGNSIFIGNNAYVSGTSSSNNIIIGNSSAPSISTSISESILIGQGSDAVNGLTNAIAIGFNSSVTNSNSMVLGNGVNVGIGVTSPRAKLHVEGGQTVYQGTLVLGPGAYSATVTDYIIKFDTSGGAAAVFLPDPTSPDNTGQVFIAKDVSGTANTNNITVFPGGSANIDGAASVIINSNYGSLTFFSDGTNYFII